MDGEMTTAMIGLGGVLVGALAGLGGTWLTVGHERRIQRRQELRDLVSGFWAASDATWRAAQSLEYAILALERSNARPEVAVIYEERRQESMRRLHEAEVEAAQHLALLRILHPSIALQATLLQALSANFEHAKRDEQRNARSSALTTFETAAREVIAGGPQWKQSLRRAWRARASMRLARKVVRRRARERQSATPRDTER